jgi:hypothetical protein
MNTKLDPIITRKLDDFRTRRRNLILLRGLCSGVLSFLGTFVLIALIDYLTEGRMTGDTRTGLSVIGYCLVLVLLWKTCLGPLLQLPSAKKLARILEQSSSDLKEDLLSAVELGVSNEASPDSDIFRQLVQKQASTKASKLDIKSVLPLGTLKYWLRGTVGLIAITIALFQIPDFGSDLKLLMQRAIMPGSNLPPVTLFDVRILTPDENVTRTPSNEPLRFVASVRPKKEGKTFKEVTLQAKTSGDTKDFILNKRSREKFFVDYNVGNEKFEYRFLVDHAPQTEWRKMEVGARPFIEKFKKNFDFPEYSELEPVEKIDEHGDLEAWEGTNVTLSLIANQPLKSGKLQIQWLEKPEEMRELQPGVEQNIIHTSILMKHPGTYRVKNLIDEKLGWEGRPSSTFVITVKPDLAPSMQWVEPIERKLLVAPNDLLSFSALAQDDLGLARVEYLIKKNRENWEAFPIPNLLDPRGKNTFAISFNLDLRLHKLKPGNKTLLKLRARDLKGTSAETETIELSVVSRDFDLTGIRLLEKKGMIIEHFDSVKEELSAMQKGLQQSLKQFQQKKDSKEALLEKVNQVEEELMITGKEAYEDNLQTLLSMPRGSDSYETSMMAKALGQVVLSSAKSWKNAIREIDAERESNRVRSKSNELTKISNNRKGMIGNFRNVAQDLLNQHAEMVAVSYLQSLQQRQRELIEDNNKRKSLPFLSRRQEVALNQWDPISEALSHSRDWQRSSTIKRIKTEQLKQIQNLENKIQTRDDLKNQMEAWNKSINEILRETHQKLASKSRESFRHKPEELYWNLKRNHFYWNDLKKEWEQILRTNPENFTAISTILGKTDILISESMMYSEVEQTKKDQNSLFVKDAGQTGRALIKIQKEIRDANTDSAEDITSLSEKSKKLGDSFQILLLQNHLIGSANQVIYFMRQENGNFSKWKGAECARQWGRIETIWKPILDSMIRMQISKEAIDIMRRLPNQDYRKKVVKEMQSRIKSTRHDPQSTVMDADLVFRDLQKIISLLKDEVLEARTFVNQVAPTLPELARELAKETEEQKNQIEEAQQNEESSLSEKQEELANLNDQQQDIGNSVENFAQALRQEANIQNLLDEEGREIARDSDDAASLVEESEREIEENLTEASKAQNEEDLVSASDKTIQEQEDLVEKLNLIAEHFENLNNQESVAETRQELRELEEELENAKQIEEQYAQAERLADLAKLAPEDLLEELEEELKSNKAMQQELSDLAQDTVEDANDQLKDALTKEEELIDELEKENKELQKQKQEIAKQLKDLAKEAQKLAEQKIESVEEEAEKAQADTLSQKAEDLQEALSEKAQQTEEAIQSKPDTQELKDAALAMAGSLEETSDDLQEIANDLNEQSELDPESALKKAEDAEKFAQESQEQADSMEEKANQLQNQAQQAQQDSLKKQIDEEKAKEEVIESKDALEEAQELASQSPNDPTQQENLEEAKSEFAQQKEDFQKAQESASLAEEQANQLTEEANLAQAEAEDAKQNAKNAKQEAKEANALAEALTDPNLQDSVNEASKKGNELAQEAAEEANDLKQQAEDLAEALDQLTEEAEGNAELLTEAEQAQEEIAEDLFETSQELARAARHEERLDNPSAGEALENIAESIEETALNELPEAAQSLENQALANELEDLAESAEKLAEDLTSNQPQGDEEIAGELNALAGETTDLIEENPSFAELQDQAEEFREQAGQTEEELSQLAEELASDAQAAQEVAESSGEAAEQAKADMQTAQSEANEAAQEADNLAQASEEAAQALENGTGTQNEASAAADNAEQLAAVAESAEEVFEKVQKQAQTDSNLANESIAEAEQASKQAEEAADLAAAANELLDQFSETPPSNELANADLPSVGMALNEVENALENQLEALENLQSGENPNPYPDTTENKPEEIQAGQSSTESPENFASTEDAFDSSTPFSDPEVSKVLAQTLDTLDQAIFSTENPFNEPANSFPTESPPSGEPIQSASMEPTTPGEPQSSETFPSEPGEPISGNRPGPGAGSMASTPSANQAIAQALQSLQLASDAHAQSMAQQRTKFMMADAQGNQLNSSDGEYQVSPVAEVGDLPKFEQVLNEDEWGKLPAKLAKDLMEAEREKVSENYRNQVQAYFQAISNKARTTKK